MTKVCGGCQTEQPLRNFAIKNKSTGLRMSYCKNCKSQYNKSFYEKNKPYFVEKAKRHSKAYTLRNKEYVYQFLLKHPCIDCGEANPIKLDFDHISDKEENICVLKSKPASIERLQREMDKCVVRCANCHRVKTAREQGAWIYKRHECH